MPGFASTALPAFRGRLDHADLDLGQHQCAVDHDRRKGRGPGAEYHKLTILGREPPVSGAPQMLRLRATNFFCRLEIDRKRIPSKTQKPRRARSQAGLLSI
jgi:hypothetical protein